MEGIIQPEDVCSIESDNQNIVIRANDGSIFVLKALLLFLRVTRCSMIRLCHLFMKKYLRHCIECHYITYKYADLWHVI